MRPSGRWISALLMPFLPLAALPAQEGELLTFAPPESPGEGKIDLVELQRGAGQSVVKILFTPIGNLEEIRDDPRLPEDYSCSGSAHGSGFFIHPAGYLVTNAHVVDNADRRTLRCRTPSTGNTTFELELIGLGETDSIDLALLRLKKKEIPRFLKLSGLAGIPILKIADSDRVGSTEEIAVLGYPEDSDDLRIKAANLSGRQYLVDYSEVLGGFQFLEVATASAVQSGNSGGAAVNRRGEVVGIPARGDWTDRTGWLIPSNVLSRFLGEIARTEQGAIPLRLLSLGILTERTFPGMAALCGAPEDLIDQEVGVAVRKVGKNSLAEQWGLRPEDILVSFRNPGRGIHAYLDTEGRVKTTGGRRFFREGGREWDNTEAPRRLLGELVLMSREGDEVELAYLRRGTPGLNTIHRKLEHRRVLQVPHLGTFQVPDHVEWAGMILQDFHTGNVDRDDYFQLEPFIRQGAVILTHVDGGGLADERNLHPGLVLHAVNGRPTGSLAALRQALAGIEAEYQAWRESTGFLEEKALYDPRNYAVIRYSRWDEESCAFVERRTTVPIERARAGGRSLTR